MDPGALSRGTGSRVQTPLGVLAPLCSAWCALTPCPMHTGGAQGTGTLCVGGGSAAPTPRPQPYLLGQAVSQASTVPLVPGGPLVDVPSEAAGTQVCDAVCQGSSLMDAEGA